MKMHAIAWLLGAAVSVTVIGCGDNDPAGLSMERFRAQLNGQNERPTPRVTPATGTADFTLVGNDTLRWSVQLTNITNVTASHIHLGGPEQAGGIILGLGASNTLITGFTRRSTFTSQMQGVSFDSLLTLMRNGNSYVNVHTNDTSNDPTNDTGPGDFPGGEIRGQIAPLP